MGRLRLVPWRVLFTLSLHVTPSAAAPWVSSNVPWIPSKVRVARHPAQFANVYANWVPDSAGARTPSRGFYNSARLIGGIPLGGHWLIGATGAWATAQLTVEHNSDADWYRRILLGPLMSYTTHTWCLNATLGFGFTGEAWNRQSQRLSPLVMGCYALSRNFLLRAGLTAGISRFGPRPLPIIGWIYKRGAFETRAAMPFRASALYWLSPRWALGGVFTGNLMLVSTPGSSIGDEQGLALPCLSAAAVANVTLGIRLMLTAGVSTSPFMRNENGVNHFARDVLPSAGVQLSFNEALVQ